MKHILPAFLFLLTFNSLVAQTTALDFTQDDCNGTSHHLFQDLEDGNVVIIEFFMNNCGACITAGNTLESLKTDLLSEFPEKIKSYAFGFNNTYDCATVSNWVSTHGFTSIPMINGATQVAYYGGMGMPTVVVLGGTNHAIIGSPYIGLATSDTTTIGTGVRIFFSQQAHLEDIDESELTLYPNPVTNLLTLDLSAIGIQESKLTILDLTGRIISSQEIRNTASLEINTSQFSNGQYVIKMENSYNTFQTRFQVIH